MAINVNTYLIIGNCQVRMYLIKLKWSQNSAAVKSRPPVDTVKVIIELE